MRPNFRLLEVHRQYGLFGALCGGPIRFAHDVRLAVQLPIVHEARGAPSPGKNDVCGVVACLAEAAIETSNFNKDMFFRI